MISAVQCRMARAALKLTVRELAKIADVSANTVTRFETEKTRGYADTVAKLQKTFEDAGIEFLPENGGGPGARLKK